MNIILQVSIAHKDEIHVRDYYYKGGTLGFPLFPPKKSD